MSEVKRLSTTYRPGTDDEFSIEFTPGSHRYKLNGEYTPSVTSILKMLAIDALPWWGMKVGVRGVAELVRRQGAVDLDNTAGVIDAFKAEGLTVNHELRRAGARGDVPHKMMAEYATTGKVPNLDDAEPEHWGFVQALAAFLVDFQPAFIHSELLVASPTHGYCGTLDGRVMNADPCQLVTDWWIENGRLREVRDTFDPALRMIDAKTGEADHDKPGKGIYTQHHLQLSGYEGAAVECGFSPTDEQLVVHLHESGRYKVARNVSSPEHFYALIPAYHAFKEIEKANKAIGKAVAA